jgi:hypothetical protein
VWHARSVADRLRNGFGRVSVEAEEGDERNSPYALIQRFTSYCNYCKLCEKHFFPHTYMSPSYRHFGYRDN